MAINNFNKTSRKDDIKLLSIIIAVFIFIVWLCTPPGNKFAQICFYGNNTRLAIAKLANKAETTEYLFHRNNAIYLSRMDRKKAALQEMDKAVMTFPVYMSDAKLESLYKDRAQLRIFYKEYNGALDDYLRVSSLNLVDKLRIALLYKEKGLYKYAMSYCNSILDLDYKAYAGYACVADLYAGVGRYDASVKVFDLLIDRAPNKAKYYLDRAGYKQKSGDFEGYDADMKKAKEISPIIDNSNLIDETLNPKALTISIVSIK